VVPLCADPELVRLSEVGEAAVAGVQRGGLVRAHVDVRDPHKRALFVTPQTVRLVAVGVGLAGEPIFHQLLLLQPCAKEPTVSCGSVRLSTGNLVDVRPNTFVGRSQHAAPGRSTPAASDGRPAPVLHRAGTVAGLLVSSVAPTEWSGG
jgi:hypothetical protein